VTNAVLWDKTPCSLLSAYQNFPFKEPSVSSLYIITISFILGLPVTQFINHFITRLGTTSNYSAIASLHTLQITAENTKSSSACNIFTSRLLVTASNSEILQLPHSDHSRLAIVSQLT
jgi:hypothetical protein